MKTNVKYSVGLDMGFKEFHACVSVLDNSQKVTVKGSKKFPNTVAGFESFSEWEKKHLKEALPIVYTMEATGVYHENLCHFLYVRGSHVSIIVPSKSRNYAKSLGISTKNDKVDAKILAQMGAERSQEAWKPFSPSMIVLRKTTRQHENLQQLRTLISNQLHAQTSGHDVNEIVKNQLLEVIELLERQISDLETEIKKLITEDTILNAKWENIKKIPGIGLLSFAVLVAETNGFFLFTNERQLVKYAGYDVVENQSGNHVGKTKISKKGNHHIRRILYMPALSAIKVKNTAFGHLWDRVFDKTKIKMKAYVAVQRKLLTIVFHIWNKDVEYNETTHKQTSSMHEPKPLFPLKNAEKDCLQNAKSAPTCVEAELDELPFKHVAESSLSVVQN